MRSNRLKVFSELSNPLHWNNLKEIYIGDNPWNTVDLKTFLKYEHLEILDILNTSIDLEAVDVTPEDISSSHSKIEHLDLSRFQMKSGIIFTKLKILPNLKTVRLIDIDAIERGEPTLKGNNNSDENWLQQATKDTSWTVDLSGAFLTLRKIE